MTDDEDFRFPQQPATEVTQQASPRRDVGGGKPPSDNLRGRAVQLADELRAHARVEAAQGQLSPTDNALMLRIEAFLRHDVGKSNR